MTPDDRFFYHSFPRRARGTVNEVEQGCKILSLVGDAGFVLSPEVLKWKYPHADGSPPREQQIVQKRICFTELPPRELLEHAKDFGSFALEFDVDVLKSLGAMPVFYIPQATDNDKTGVTSLGSTLVIQLIDAMILAMRLTGVRKNLDDAPDATAGRFDCEFGFEKPKKFNLDVAETRRVLEAFCFALTPPNMLEHALTSLLSCFYPADNVPGSQALAYYRQREWRIAWNLSVEGKNTLHRPSAKLIERLLEIDADFFGRDFTTSSGTGRLVDEVYVYPGIGDRRILEMVRRVVVPRAAIDPVSVIIRHFGVGASVVCIEDLK
jgi:Putative abortive phage resistance protein AbiGi, antitoxin